MTGRFGRKAGSIQKGKKNGQKVRLHFLPIKGADWLQEPIR